MKSIEISARTVEEAIRQAVRELKVSRDEMEIEILEESTKGFLGLIGGKLAKIKVRKKQDPLKTVKTFLEEITARIGIKTSVIVKEEDDLIKITLIGKNLGVLIGRRGETLDSLQYLANLVANKHCKEKKRVIIDAEGYRKRREETLIRLAKRLADRVKRSGTRVVLEPMNPQERRIIHTALQNDRYVQTLSEGEEPFRKVVISLRK